MSAPGGAASVEVPAAAHPQVAVEGELAEVHQEVLAVGLGALQGVPDVVNQAAYLAHHRRSQAGRYGYRGCRHLSDRRPQGGELAERSLAVHAVLLMRVPVGAAALGSLFQQEIDVGVARQGSIVQRGLGWHRGGHFHSWSVFASARRARKRWLRTAGSVAPVTLAISAYDSLSK